MKINRFFTHSNTEAKHILNSDMSQIPYLRIKTKEIRHADD